MMLEISVRFVMDVLSHSWDSRSASHWMQLVRSLLTEDEAGLSRCEWIVREFISDAAAADLATGVPLTSRWLRWGVLSCRVPEVREQVAETLVRAVSLLSSAQQQQGQQEEQRMPLSSSSSSPAAAAAAAAGFSCPPERDLPHCLPMLSASRGTQEHIKAFSEAPLLTDEPWPRRFPGGLDHSKDFPRDYLPFPRPATSVGSLIDQVLELLPHVTTHWR